MSLTIDHSRQENGREKRQEQLARWDESQTATISDDRAAYRGGPSKIKFGSGAIFLSACQAGDYEEIEAVLRDNDDITINYANSDGLTALHSATIDGNVKMVKYLISKGADINVQDHEGWSCLHAAASCGYVEIAKILVENKIDLLPVTSEGELAQDVAAEDNPKMKKYLDELYASIDTEAEHNKEEQLMFHDASQFYHYYKKFNKVYEPEPIDPSTKAGPLHVAAAKGYLTVIKLLLEAGFSPHKQDADGWTPLHAACHWEQQEAAEYLAAYGANFNIRNSLGQRPIDVLTAQKLIPKIRDLGKNRPKRESLPELPELPPFSLPEPQPEPTPATPEPEPTTSKTLPSRTIEQPKREPEQNSASDSPKKPKVGFANLDKEQRADSPWDVKLKQNSNATASPSVKKREKYGVQDDSISVKDSFRQFETSGKEIRRTKRVSSTVENPDSDQRHTGQTPIPGLLNEVERSHKAKNKRKTRQATTGVTLDVYKQAKELAEKSMKKNQTESKSSTSFDRNTDPVSFPSGYIPSDQRTEQPSINALLNPNIAKQEMLRKMLAKKTDSKKSPSETKKSIVPSVDSSESSNATSLPAGRSSSDSTHSAATRKTSSETTKNNLEAPAPSARTRTTSETRRNSDMEFPQHLSRIRSPVPDKNEDAEVDYKSKYEDLKRKLEEQARRIQTLEAEKADLAKDKATLSEKLSNMQLNGSYDSETERLENLKLKQENAALIRIIAKVSK